VSTDYAALAAMVGGGQVITGPESALFSESRRIGLKEADARHLVNAVSSACIRFVTTDRDFLNRRAQLESLCEGLKIVAPSELAAELNAAAKKEGAG
jgi:hypothetical protein